MIGPDSRYRSQGYSSYSSKGKSRGSGRWVSRSSFQEATRTYSPRSFSPARPMFMDHQSRSRHDSLSSSKSTAKFPNRVFHSSNSGSRNSSFERQSSREEIPYSHGRRGKVMTKWREHHNSPEPVVWRSPDYHHHSKHNHMPVRPSFPFPVTLADRSSHISQQHEDNVSVYPIPITNARSPLMPHVMSVLMGTEEISLRPAFDSNPPHARSRSVPLLDRPCTTIIPENLSKSYSNLPAADVAKPPPSFSSLGSSVKQIHKPVSRSCVGPEDAVRLLPRGFQMCPVDSPEKRKLGGSDVGGGDAGLAPGVWLSEQLGPTSVNPSQVTVEALLGNPQIGLIIQRLQALQISNSNSTEAEESKWKSPESNSGQTSENIKEAETLARPVALEVRVDVGHRRRLGGGDATLEDVTDSGYSSNVSACASFHPTPSTSPFLMDPLSRQMYLMYSQTVQSRETFFNKKKVRDILYSSVYHTFHHCGLYMVGSSSNGFGSDSSDLDLCLMIMPTEICQRTDAIRVLNLMKDCLTQNCPIVNGMEVIPARVPILRISLNPPFHKIEVDVNANMSVAIRNTHLLRHYAHSVDWRVQPLVLVVKQWAKRQCINDAAHSTLSSYSLVLMVLHFLQCGVHPPVLPSLQRALPTQFHLNSDVRTLDYNPDTELCKLHPSPSEVGFKSENHQSLSELFLGFLDYFANDFNYETDAISIRAAKRLARETVCRSRSPHNRLHQWHCLCIEEPFTSTNTALSVYDVRIFNRVKETFKRSYESLKAKSTLESVLSEVLVIDVPPQIVSPPTNN